VERLSYFFKSSSRSCPASHSLTMYTPPTSMSTDRSPTPDETAAHTVKKFEHRSVYIHTFIQYLKLKEENDNVSRFQFQDCAWCHRTPLFGTLISGRMGPTRFPVEFPPFIYLTPPGVCGRSWNTISAIRTNHQPAASPFPGTVRGHGHLHTITIIVVVRTGCLSRLIFGEARTR